MRAATGVPSVGTLWSAVASVRSGRRTRAPGEAQAVEGLRARDLVHEVQVDVEQARRRPRGRPRSCRTGFAAWWSQLLRRPADDDGQEGRLAGAGVLEVVGQVGVEGHAVAGGELVALAVDVEHDGAVLDERRSRGCRARASAGRPGRPSRAPAREHVAAELGALAGQRRGEDLEAVPAGRASRRGGARRRGRRSPCRPRRGAAAGSGAARGRRRCGWRPAASGSSRRARPG